MPDLQTLILFVAAAMVVIITPGPSNLYVMARAIGQGTGAGMLATTGLALGGLVHVAGAAVGLSVVFQYSPLAYTAVKIAGASYGLA